MKNQNNVILRNLSVGHGERVLCSIEELRLTGGRLVGLRGANGSGKTSLLRAIAGLDAKLSGEVVISVRGVHTTPSSARHEGLLVYLPQRRNVFLTLTVAENIAVVARKPAATALHGVVWEEGKAFCSENLRRSPMRLSGGERQVVALVGAMSGGSMVTLLDEPTEGLSGSLRKSAFQFLRNSVETTGGLVFCVDHNLDLLAQYCHETWEIIAGRLVQAK